jgi:hypothetical protein
MIFEFFKLLGKDFVIVLNRWFLRIGMIRAHLGENLDVECWELVYWLIFGGRFFVKWFFCFERLVESIEIF